MTSTTRVNRSLCCICGQVPSLSFCTGCERVFCPTHAEKHRQELSTLLDKIIDDHNQCQQTMIQYTEQSVHHPLIKQINEWESQSIEKIHQVANESRKQVFSVLVQFASNAMTTMKQLTEQLTDAQKEENFIENDLRQWMETLNKIKKQLDKPPTIHIRRGTNENPLIAKLLINVCDIFEQSAGKISVKDDGKLLVNYGSNGYGTARSQGEYSVGKHRIRLKIEHTGTTKWNLIGIVSKSIAIKPTAFDTPSSFGWIANSFVCLNGKVRSDYQGYRCDLEKNDIVELMIDCNQRIIRWTNERTKNSHELPVDINLCPFPWQFHVGLFYSKDRLRILWK